MSAFFKYVIFVLLAFIGCFVVGGVVGAVASGDEFSLNAMLTGQYSLIIGGVLFLLFLVWFLLRVTNDKKGPLFKSSGKISSE